ncbi:MAG: DNA-binding response regulator [Betaproteobacteria bacterium RIFCSPLOWO2_02_FULL_62_17]|nr:MAG: DNA-binding response regulator [Betaproteobacteria bacterium RIFCSPLOWO2_02_FULL_62_17]
MRIALLEDDRDQILLLRGWLEGAGHSLHAYERGGDFLREVARESFDIFLIDWMIPDKSGMEVLNWVRANLKESVPVVFVTARDAEEDIVSVLQAGADDYMVKPLRKAELIARINAVARRTRPAVNDAIAEYGEYRVDSARRSITRHGEEIELTQKDFDLAVFLFRNLGRLLSRGHIFEAVWGQSTEISTRTIDTHVSRLRTRLSLTPENGWRLGAVYQHGYRLERLTH